MSSSESRIHEVLARVATVVVGQVALIERVSAEPYRLHYCIDHLDGGLEDVERKTLYGTDIVEMPYLECVTCRAVLLFVADERRS